MKSLFLLLGLILIISAGYFAYNYFSANPKAITSLTGNVIDANLGGPDLNPHPLSIENLRQGEYPGSDFVVEQELSPGSNYSRSIVSYKSDGLKIYALLTIPNGTPPEGGFPAIVFNHGYIPPAQYRTTERYISYTDGFSKNGYVLLKTDYRGHGNSEGEAEGGYGSNAYTIDVLNALASLKKLENVNKDKIGMWGHSMGGHITLRSMVASKDIKAGVIWAGVVVSYPDLIERWRRGNANVTTTPSPFPTTSNRGGWRRGLIEQFGTPQENPDFWNSISSNSFLSDISGPVQLHHGTADHSVPYEFSQTLADQLKKEGKEVELYIYQGDEHDIPNNFGMAMNRSVEFFDKYLK
jgi:uncharacterized protein